MMTTRSLTLALLVGALPTVAPAADPLEHCDANHAERIRFIESRLEQRRTYADYWWKGWTAGYGAGTVVEAVLAGTEDRKGRQADYAVSAAKAAFGTARLILYPPSARLGADPMRAIDPVNDAACQQRLEVGEGLLRQNAKESEARWDWKRHLANVAINVAGGLIVAEGFDEDRGWTSMGVGIAVGEAMTFSHPWKSDDDLADYEQRFAGAPPPSHVSFSIGPWRQGAALRIAF
jgi:hypothetical protein